MVGIRSGVGDDGGAGGGEVVEIKGDGIGDDN